MIPTFNSTEYLGATLSSVLGQAPGYDRMQIEVVDDCSTKDEPGRFVAETCKDRVAFFRHETNLGVTGNFNACVERSRGELVHILHSDDWILPGFYNRIAEAAAAHPEVGLFAVRSFLVDESGQVDGLSPRCPRMEKPTQRLDELLYHNLLCTPGVVIRRAAYERQGGFRTDLIHAADWEMWLRQVAREGGLVLNEPLACYRQHGAADTGRLARSSENLRDLLRLEDYVAALCPGFSSAAWRWEISRRALDQSLFFRFRGDASAAAASLSLHNEITPFRIRFLQRLELFCRDRTRRWWHD